MNEELKTQEEVKEETAPPEETVGEMMKKSGSQALKFWMIVVSAIVYAAGIVYAEVHGMTMLQKGVAPEMRIWATLGMVAAGMTALAMPVVLKVWTIEAKQRIFTYFFYALDFAFLIFNAFTDFNTQQGQTLAPWAQNYVTYILPVSPALVALLWALVWELDPSVKEKVLLLSLRAAMKEKLAHKVADAAKGANVSQAINQAAQKEVDLALWELFGAKPADGYYVVEPQEQGILKSFFGMLSSQLRRAISELTLSQSDRPNSNETK